MFDERPRENSVSSIPTPPNKCSVYGCNDDTAVLILVVRDGSGRTTCGASSEFCITKKEVTVMKTQYTFLHWVSRCCACYDKDLRRVGHQALKLEPEVKKAAA